MEIYLPIAEIPIQFHTVFIIGMITGLLAGILGIGGGFLAAPLLIFNGIPPLIAVSTCANQTIAASFSRFYSHLRNKRVDIKMGAFMLSGGLVGSTLGVLILSWLKKIGQIDITISILYIIFLGVISVIMGVESATFIYKKIKRLPTEKTDRRAVFTHKLKLPFVRDFPASGIRISVLIPIFVGFFSSIIVSIMGIGGGFILIPSMIYIIGMPARVIVGTSLMQIMLIASNVTILQSIHTHSVDLMLSLLLISGSVIGVQFGIRISGKFAPEYLRGMLAVVLLTVMMKLIYGLFIEPTHLFEIIEMDTA